MAYIPDEPFYFLQADTLEMMRYFRGMYESFDEKMFYRLQEFFPGIDMKRNIRRLSRGMQKQVAFWLALCCRPKLLILDEPLDGLDPVMRKQIWTILMSEVAERRTTVLVSSHNLRELEDVCDHVGIMNLVKVIIERSLFDLHGNISKIQVACQTGMPKLPKEFEVLHMSNSGRVYTMIVKGNPREVAAAIQTEGDHLAIVDILPLTQEVPGQLWSRLQQQTDMTAYARDYALYNSLRLEVDVAAIAIMAVVCGMALFGYLFTQKNAYMIHALPVTRGELYVTNMISGLCFLLIPQALVFLVTVVLCLLKGIASVQFLGLWFLSVMGIAFFLYATVCFCVMFTGQLFALPVYFLAVNYVAFAFSSGARYVIGYLGYGLGMDTVPEFLILRILSPMNYLYNNVRFVFRQSYNQETDLMSGVLSYRGLRVLAAYVAAAVVIYLIAYYCYKKRRIESAGDLISFNWVKPLFRWGVGTGVGYFAGVLMAEFLDSVHLHVKKPMLLVLVVAFGFVSFFIAQMFVEKGFRVFCRRRFCESGLFVMFVLGSFWGCSKNATYLEQYVPDADQVSRVEVSLDYPVEYKGDSVRVARQAQKEILSHAEIYRENKTDDSTQIIFYYYLKNGKTLSRTYEIVGGNETLSELLFKEENKVDHFMEYLFGTDSDKISKFSTGTLTLNESSENYKDCDFDADTAKKLYQAIYEDAADQKLQKYNLTNALKDPEETGEYSSASISLDYYHASADWKNVYDRIDDYYGNTGESVETPTTYGGSAYISFGKDCTHIIQTLIDCGVITDVSDIQFQRPEEKTSQ